MARRPPRPGAGGGTVGAREGPRSLGPGRLRGRGWNLRGRRRSTRARCAQPTQLSRRPASGGASPPPGVLSQRGITCSVSCIDNRWRQDKPTLPVNRPPPTRTDLETHCLDRQTLTSPSNNPWCPRPCDRRRRGAAAARSPVLALRLRFRVRPRVAACARGEGPTEAGAALPADPPVPGPPHRPRLSWRPPRWRLSLRWVPARPQRPAHGRRLACRHVLGRGSRPG